MGSNVGGGTQLVEREGEIGQIDSALERVSAGAGSLIVIEGPAGIGKSRLLAEACVAADERGLQVLRARGGVLERDLAYSAVRLLLERPLAALDAAQREDVLGGAAALAAPALSPAGIEQQVPADRGFAVIHGLFWCVANLADRCPLLLALDDAHWFDAASLRFVLYLARRVADLPVALIVATREDECGPEPMLVQQLTIEPEAQILRPAPLTQEGVAAVLGRRMGTTAPEFDLACHAAVGGNPFLLSELTGALVRDRVRPTAEGAAGVRGVRPRTLARAILLRLDRMAPGARELATAVAVLGEDATIEQAARLAEEAMPEAAEAIDRLAAAQILTAGRRLEFVHPIVRETVYRELGPAEREDWHVRAARLVAELGGPIERAALHLLSTTPGGRADVVEALRSAGGSALNRGAADIAERYLSRALAEPPTEAQRAATLLELGRAEFFAGQPTDGPKAHLREAIGLIDDPSARAQIWLLLAWVTVMDAGSGGVAAVLEEALVDVGNAVGPHERERLQTELDYYGLLRPDTIAVAGARLDALLAPEGRTAAERLRLCNLAVRSSYTGSSAARTAELAQRSFAGGQLVADEGPANGTIYGVSQALTMADCVETAERLLELAISEGRARGSLWGIGAALSSRARLEFARGQIAEAEADARQGLAVPALRPFTSIDLCHVLIERGELDEAEQVMAATACGPDLPEGLHHNFVFWSRGRLRVAQGRLPEALADLLEFGRRSERVDLRNPWVSWRADAALVQAGLGQRAAAESLAGEYHELARAWGTPRVLGISARTRGLLCGGGEGLALLREAVEAHESSPARLEHARSLLELGAALRRAGRRSEALQPLRGASALAQGCGATVLAARVHEELAVAGVTGRRYAFSGTDALTPSELRVARMASEGLSNRAIAQTLFVTAKTVENHLGRVYVKLGIGSRTALADALGLAGSGQVRTPPIRPAAAR